MLFTDFDIPHYSVIQMLTVNNKHRSSPISYSDSHRHVSCSTHSAVYLNRYCMFFFLGLLECTSTTATFRCPDLAMILIVFTVFSPYVHYKFNTGYRRLEENRDRAPPPSQSQNLACATNNGIIFFIYTFC